MSTQSYLSSIPVCLQVGLSIASKRIIIVIIMSSPWFGLAVSVAILPPGLAVPAQASNNAMDISISRASTLAVMATNFEERSQIKVAG